MERQIWNLFNKVDFSKTSCPQELMSFKTMSPDYFRLLLLNWLIWAMSWSILSFIRNKRMKLLIVTDEFICLSSWLLRGFNFIDFQLLILILLNRSVRWLREVVLWYFSFSLYFLFALLRTLWRSRLSIWFRRPSIWEVFFIRLYDLSFLLCWCFYWILLSISTSFKHSSNWFISSEIHFNLVFSLCWEIS